MDDPITFKLEISLRRLAKNAFAIGLWESPIIKQKTEEFFRTNRQLKDFKKITEEVLQQVHAFLLPSRILFEIQDAVRSIGKKIFQWTMRVIDDLGLNLKYAEKICWTYYGTVDEIRIFKSHWQNDPTLLTNDFKKSLYSLACIFGHEKFVLENIKTMREMLKEYSDSIIKIPVYSLNSRSLISKWLCFYIGRNKREGRQIHEDVFSEAESSEAKLIQLCATNQFINAVKYFANNLKKEEKDELFFKCTNTLEFILKANHESDNTNAIEIFLFLMNELSTTKKILCLKETLPGLFYATANTPPYHDIFLQMFNYALPFMTDDEHQTLLFQIFNYIYAGNRIWCLDDSYPTVVATADHVLLKLLKLLPKEAKGKVINAFSYTFALINCQSHFSTMELFLKDANIELRNQVILEAAEEVIRICSLKNESHLLNEFMEIILQDQDKELFKNHLEMLRSLNSEASDKLLTWITSSEEEKN